MNRTSNIKTNTVNRQPAGGIMNLVASPYFQEEKLLTSAHGNHYWNSRVDYCTCSLLVLDLVWKKRVFWSFSVRNKYKKTEVGIDK